METIDPNASVSNAVSVEETFPAPQPPSTGQGPVSDAGPEGMEYIEGYKPLTPETANLTLAESEEQLRDIGEASFGPSPEAVIGVDDRVQITNTNAYPWRAIASLLITARDNSRWIGTAWFISPRTLATAGHCVYIKNSGVPGRDGWVKSITVIPGRNGNTMPFGSAVSTQFRSVSGWTNNGDEKHDYGAIILNVPLGDTVGTFGYGVYTDADLLTVTANISGYPGDKPAGTQWFHARKVTSVGPQKVFYDVDTASGQSGAPVWRLIGGNRFAVAVHAYGGATSNSGTRITSAVSANLTAWKL